jgi:hypothetical protein
MTWTVKELHVKPRPLGWKWLTARTTIWSAGVLSR